MEREREREPILARHFVLVARSGDVAFTSPRGFDRLSSTLGPHWYSVSAI